MMVVTVQLEQEVMLEVLQVLVEQLEQEALCS